MAPTKQTTAAAAKESTPKKEKKTAAPKETAPAKKSKQPKTKDAVKPLETKPETEKAPAKSKSSKKKAPSPLPAPVEDEEEDAAAVEAMQSSDEEDEEEDTYLHGFSDDEDSSDDDEVNEGPSAFEIQKLPTIAKDDATVKRKLEKAKRNPTVDKGVVYVGRLPHGFFEDQLKGYFSQFGEVTRLRLSRNKKTGKSKHCAFIEFDSSSVAQIVSETMDNYLLMGHILRCKVIPQDEIHPQLWVGANRKWRTVPVDRVIRVQHNRLRTEGEQQQAAKRLVKRQNERKRKIAEAGIKYDFDQVSYKKPKSATEA